ncbi:MAG: Unknown protein, partial [uncultured Sulfurovum sp.]
MSDKNENSNVDTGVETEVETPETDEVLENEEP